MNAQQQNLINRQHQRMRELREDVRDLASTVADEVWDKFEVEIEETIGDEFIFDTASGIQMSLAITLAMNYDDAFECHVQSFFERQQQELRSALPDLPVFDDAKLNLAGLRKGLKLRRHADEVIANAIEAAKPGLIGMLFLARDPTSDAWDRELSDNAKRVRRKLLDTRGTLTTMMIEETQNVINTARLAYIDWLDAIQAKIPAQQTETDYVQKLL